MEQIPTKDIFDRLFLRIGQPVKFHRRIKIVRNKESTMYRYGYISAIHKDFVAVLTIKEDGFNTSVPLHERVNIEDLVSWKPRKNYLK